MIQTKDELKKILKVYNMVNQGRIDGNLLNEAYEYLDDALSTPVAPQIKIKAINRFVITNNKEITSVLGIKNVEEIQQRKRKSTE